MKMYLAFTIFIAMLLANMSMASDISSQVEELKRQGFVVRMGELTGAGGKLSLSQVQGFIHPEKIIKKTSCTSISVRPTSNPSDPKLSDVTKIKVGTIEVSAQELVGTYSLE